MAIANNMKWRERTKRAAEKNFVTDELAEKRANRATLYAQQAAKAEANIAAQAKAEAALLVSCPCCAGEGRITVERAEVAYRAHALLPSWSKPDVTVTAHLVTVSRGQVDHGPGLKVANGLSYPTRAITSPLAEPVKAEKRSPARGLSSSETPDGALIEP